MKLIHDRVIYDCENKDLSDGVRKERYMRVTEKLVKSPDEEGVTLEYIRLTKDFEEIKEYVQHKGNTLTGYKQTKEKVSVRIEDILYFETVDGRVFAYENELATFEQRGKGTIDLALENPNLFRFLYMGERSQLLSIGFELQTDNQDAANVYQEVPGQMKAVVTDKWILCPVCCAKTRTQILDDTELKHMLQHLRKNENIRRRYGIRYH